MSPIKSGKKDKWEKADANDFFATETTEHKERFEKAENLL